VSKEWIVTVLVGLPGAALVLLAFTDVPRAEAMLGTLLVLVVAGLIITAGTALTARR
jgi:uncharacterized membrane protein YqjE